MPVRVTNLTNMIGNYLKIALRALARQKALAFINIAGLSIGLACFILFLQYAVNEFSYDRFRTTCRQHLPGR